MFHLSDVKKNKCKMMANYNNYDAYLKNAKLKVCAKCI